MGRPKSTKCGECKKSVTENSEAVQCDLQCNLWFHIECIGMAQTEYLELKDDEQWYCEKCSIKDSNNLLKREIQNLTNIIDMLQSDLKQNKVECDNLRKQNNCLNELVLEKELEIVKLKEDERICEEWNKLPRGRQTATRLGKELHTNSSPLNLSNKFSCLSVEEGLDEESVDRQCSGPASTEGKRKKSDNRTNFGRVKLHLSNTDFPPLQHHRGRLSDGHDARDSLRRGRWTSENVAGSSGNKIVTDRHNRGHDSVVDKGSCTKHKILIMADSHGRDLGTYLHSKTSRDRFDVFSVCRPGAKLENVLCDVEAFAKEFTKKDTVIIIGGSNNINELSVTVLTDSIVSRIVELSEKTNVILATLPTRFDKLEFNDAIHRCNFDMYESIWSRKVEFLSLNKYQRKLFTTHGQHLNKKGKYILCTDILNSLEGFLG